MKIQVDQHALMTALKYVKLAMPKHARNSAASPAKMFLLEADKDGITISGAGLIAAVRARINCTVIEQGRVFVHQYAGQLLNIVPECMVDIERYENNKKPGGSSVVFRFGCFENGVYTFNGLTYETAKYDPWPESAGEEREISLDRDGIAGTLQSVLYAADNISHSRFNSVALVMHKGSKDGLISAMATDRARAAIAKNRDDGILAIDSGGDNNYIVIDADGLKIANKLLRLPGKVSLSYDNKYFYVTIATVQRNCTVKLAVRKLDTSYPVKFPVDPAKYNIRIDAARLLQMTQSAIAAGGNNNDINEVFVGLHLTDDHLCAGHGDTVTVTIKGINDIKKDIFGDNPQQFSFPKMTVFAKLSTQGTLIHCSLDHNVSIKLNGQFLCDAVKTAKSTSKSGYVMLGLNDEMAPVIVRAADETQDAQDAQGDAQNTQSSVHHGAHRSVHHGIIMPMVS